MYPELGSILHFKNRKIKSDFPSENSYIEKCIQLKKPEKKDLKRPVGALIKSYEQILIFKIWKF